MFARRAGTRCYFRHEKPMGAGRWMRGPLSMAVRSTAVRDSTSECEAIVNESKSTQACTRDCEYSNVYWLQGITILWMIVECGVSLYAAWSARSVAMLAFGGD